MKNFLLTILLLLTNLYLGFAQTQVVRGQIVDQQSQFPLIGATVYIADSNPVIGASTDSEGYFELRNVPLGRVALKVSYIGYKEQFIPNILVTSGKEVVINVALEEQIVAADEIVIIAEQDKTQTNNELATVSARSFTIEESSRYAGSRNDPARMATNFAGVSGANDSRNDIIIRGNSPTGLLWRFEGIDIPSPNHFSSLGATGGPVGMLNNNVLANSDFFTGAFPAEYGNANAGVFDLKMRNGNNSKREYLFQIGFAGVEAGAEGPFSKNSRASYLVNYRYSTLAFFDVIGLDFGTGSAVPQYQDLSFKIDLPTKNAGRFSLFGLGGISNIDLLGSEEVTTDPNDAFGDINEDLRFESGTGIVGLKHLFYWDDKTYSEVTMALSGTYDEAVFDSLGRAEDGTVIDQVFQGAVDISQVRYSLRAEVNRKFNARNTVRLGIINDFFDTDVVDSLRLPLSEDFQVLRDFSGTSNLFQGYIQWQHRFNDRLTFNLGVHYQRHNLSEAESLEPRVGIQYRLSPKQSISFGFGMHSQLQPLLTYIQETETEPGVFERTNQNLDFTRSTHYVIAYDNAISNNFRIKLETYYQQISDAPVDGFASSFSLLNEGDDFGFSDNSFLVSRGTGFNYGVELTLEKFYSNNYYFLITNSLFNSRYTGSDGVERNTAFNGNFVSNFLFGREFQVRENNAFFVDAKLTWAGGRRFTPIDVEASVANGFEVAFEDQAFEEQLPDYFRLDLKAGYRINRPKVSHEFFVDVQNVTNRDNILRREYNPATGLVSNTNQLGLFPVIQYKLQF